MGSIEGGKIADLVLLDANPLADIRNTRRIAGVFRAGRWVPRAIAQASLDSLSKSYAPLQDALDAFVVASRQKAPSPRWRSIARARSVRRSRDRSKA